METIAELTNRFSRPGRVDWIGLRPERGTPMRPVHQARVTGSGLEGDRARAGKRAVTLIQAEHLAVIAALAGLGAVGPEVLRRNLVISGLNLGALRGREIGVGTARLRITGPCAPCSRMEAALGFGGYTAMRGHGGWCAEVLAPGNVALGDPVSVPGAEMAGTG